MGLLSAMQIPEVAGAMAGFAIGIVLGIAIASMFWIIV